MKIVAITQARMGSTRLPGKILMQIQNQTLLELHVRRIQKSQKINELLVATTVDAEDEKTLGIAGKLGVPAYRGSVQDVLDRFYQALQGKSADYVVRLTSDCPLIDGQLIDKVIQFVIDRNLDYGSNTLNPTYPDGQDIEVFKYQAIEKAWKEANLLSEREHVTPYIWKNSSYKGGHLFASDNFEEGYSFGHLRMTVDEQKDFDVINALISGLGADGSWLDYARYLEQHKDVKSLNEAIGRNEGYSKTLKKDK